MSFIDSSRIWWSRQKNRKEHIRVPFKWLDYFLTNLGDLKWYLCLIYWIRKNKCHWYLASRSALFIIKQPWSTVVLQNIWTAHSGDSLVSYLVQLWRWVITAYFVFRSFVFSFSTRPILQTAKKGGLNYRNLVVDQYRLQRLQTVIDVAKKNNFNYMILPLRLTCQDWLFSFCQHIVVQTWELADQSHSDPVWTTAALLRSKGCGPSWQAPGNRGDCGTGIYIYFG